MRRAEPSMIVIDSMGVLAELEGCHGVADQAPLKNTKLELN
jgi:hypothetical protein